MLFQKILISVATLFLLTSCEKHGEVTRYEKDLKLSKVSQRDLDAVVTDACRDIAHKQKHLFAVKGYGVMVPGASGDYLGLEKKHTIIIMPGTSDAFASKADEIYNHVVYQYAEAYNKTQLANPYGCATGPHPADGPPDVVPPAPDQSRLIAQ